MATFGVEMVIAAALIGVFVGMFFSLFFIWATKRLLGTNLA